MYDYVEHVPVNKAYNKLKKTQDYQALEQSDVEKFVYFDSPFMMPAPRASPL